MFDNFFTIFQPTERPPKVDKDTKAVEENYSALLQSIQIPTPDIEVSMPTNLFEVAVEPPEPSQPKVKFNFPSQNPRTVELKGPEAFEKAFAQAVKINPEIKKYKNFLVKTAKRESGFNSRIQNTTGAPYYGYFQMGASEIKRTTGLSVEQFRNDPVQQILGAVKLYELNLKTIKAIGVYDIGRERGYSDDALVAGAWMGGPGGVKKYLLGQGDPSDAHWYKKAGQKGGSSVGRIMNNWKANE